MNNRWLFLAFAAGVVVGILITRAYINAPTIAATEADVDVPRAPQSAAPAANGAAEATPAPSTVASDRKIEPAPVLLTSVAAPPPDQSGIPADDAAVQRIDAGPVFNEVIGRPSQPGFENQLGDAHRALERETRNDGWAYTMEGEIQNAMVNEVSTGEFRADHVECRATLCEVRLSGKGNQAAAIKRWSESLGPQPFGQRLFLNYSSSISNNERVDSIMIFRKPPPAPPKPH
jgi:hypothetical protein